MLYMSSKHGCWSAATAVCGYGKWYQYFVRVDYHACDGCVRCAVRKNREDGTEKVSFLLLLCVSRLPGACMLHVVFTAVVYKVVNKLAYAQVVVVKQLFFAPV